MKEITIEEYQQSFKTYNNIRKAILRVHFRIYHRLSIIGKENIPDGPVLVACNHSGGFDLDTMAISTFPVKNRDIKVLYWEKYHFLNNIWGRYFIGDSVPVWATGGIRYEYIDPYFDAAGKNFPGILCIFPEGRSLLFKERNTLDKFYPGVIRLALKYRVPIVPAAMIGFHEACPVLSAVRHENQPDDPITFLPFVLPKKLTIHYGRPIYLNEYYGKTLSKEEEFNLANEIVKGSIAAIIKTYNPRFAV